MQTKEESIYPYKDEGNFMMMLEHHCPNHHIITSTDGLTYRVEVYKDGDLEDAVEISCEELKSYPESDVLFQTRYKQAHEEFVDKFCTDSFITPNEEEGRGEKNESNGLDEEKNIPESRTKLDMLIKHLKEYMEQGHTYRKKVFFLGSIIVLVVFIVLGRTLLCSEVLINLFSNPINFYEKTEYFCHKLEKECVLLSKTNLDQDTKFKPKDCFDWCEEKIIDKERCSLFLPYFPKENIEESNINYIKPETNEAEVAPETIAKSEYTFSPEGTSTLILHKYLKLGVTNNSKKVFKIELESLHLKESEHEEIVQFRSGITAFSIEEGKTKHFEIFLEPTYYEQFERGEYHGVLRFKMLFDKNRTEEIEKDFFLG